MNKKLMIVMALVATFILAFASLAFADSNTPISSVTDPEFLARMATNKALSPGWIGVDAQNLPSTMPVFQSSNGVINEIVWVEVPVDTDRDGKRDRISLWIRRPAVPAGFLCPAVMEFSPYHNGTVGYSRMSAQINNPDDHIRGMAQSFAYKPNEDVHLAINPDTTHLTYDDIRYKGVEAWDTIWWSTDNAFTVGSWYTGTDYSGIQTFTDEYGTVRTRKLYTGTVPAATVPGNNAGSLGTFTGSAAWSGSQGFPARWNHYLVRGYACIYGQLLGNRAVEGITNSLHVEEWISAAAACMWLNGEAKAFTTRDGNIEVKASWALGFVSLDGTSYPGTTPTIAAMAGVKGVKALMPEAHVASWYEYYRSGGALHGPEGYGGEDMNLHSSFNFSRINSDSTSGIPSPTGRLFPKVTPQEAYVETQFYMMDQQDRTTADYNAAWDFRNLTRAYGQFADDVGILQTNGQQDWNVMPRHAYQALQAWRDKFGGTHKIVSTLTTHASQTGRLVQGTDNIQRGMLKWYLMFLDHFLLGLDNHVDELMYDVNIVNQQTGVMEGYNYDTAKEERGTILPGTFYQQIYLTEGPAGKAGRLSYNTPAVSVNSFTDMNVITQLKSTAAAGSSNQATNVSIPWNSGQGNYTPSGTQITWCDDRVVGVNRTATTYAVPGGVTYPNLISAIDRPVDGRLMYISEPLEEDMRLSGTVVVHLNAAPTKGTGNLTVALLELGRIPRVACRTGSSASSTGATSVTVFPLENGAAATTASTYGRTGTPARVGTSTCNFKFVTWGHTDIQNPSTDGKAWFEVPEHNYTPNYYFQTTAITPGQYYDYVVELNPYNYVFEKGMQLAIMVYGTDSLASPNLDAASTSGLDIELGAGTYINIPLQVVEPQDPVTLEIGSAVVLPGDDAEITYTLKDNVFGFTSFDFDLTVNTSAFTPLMVTPSALLSSGTFNFTISGNDLHVSFEAPDNVVGDGELFTVTYGTQAGAYSVYSPLNVAVNSFKFASFMDKLVEVPVIKKGVVSNADDTAGYLCTYDYNVYLVPSATPIFAGDTVYVDVMLAGGINYVSMAADVTFDNNLLQLDGYHGLTGFITNCALIGSDVVRLSVIPGMNMIYGETCQPDVCLVTLEFTALDNFGWIYDDAKLSVEAIKVNPPAGYLQTRTAPGKDVNITIVKKGAFGIKFPGMSDVQVSYLTNGVWTDVNGLVHDQIAFLIPAADVPLDGKITFSVAKKTAELAGLTAGHTFTFPEMTYDADGFILTAPTAEVAVKVVTATGQLGLWDTGAVGPPAYTPGWIYPPATAFSSTTTHFPIFDNGDIFEVRFANGGPPVTVQVLAGDYIEI